MTSVALRAAGAALAVFVSGAASAFAADCKPQTLLASVDLVSVDHDSAEFAPVTIAGVPKVLLIDTGGAVTEITPASTHMIVMPGTGYEDQPGFAGILAPDILRNFDVDIDYGTHKMNLISPDHCQGKVIYWQASAVAAIPMTVQDNGHIVIPVTLDGHLTYAMLDTGAAGTTLIQSDAQSVYGLKLGDADTPKAGDLQDSPGVAIYTHVFDSLGFEGIG